MFDRIVESIIKDAMERGDFDNLPGKGKPVDLTEYFETPEDVRLAHSVLKNAGMTSREVDLLNEIAELRQLRAAVRDEQKKHQIEAQIRHWREAVTSARGQADRAAMALAARELRYWSARRATAELVPTRPATEVVRFGSRVTLGRADGSTVAFRIVGEDEADPALGKISWVAPLARSVLGRSAGESVVFQEQTAEIRAID